MAELNGDYAGGAAGHGVDTMAIDLHGVGAACGVDGAGGSAGMLRGDLWPMLAHVVGFASGIDLAGGTSGCNV